MGAYQLAPPESWSQIVEQTPGYGLTGSSGGMTTPSTTVAGMPGYVAPPPGLTPPDFSSWSLPPPEAPLSRGLPTASQGLPGIGRSTLIRGAVERHTRAQLALGLRAPAQWAQAPPTSVPCTPQMVPPLCQPPPSQTATPYQQAVQPAGKSTRRGVTFDSSADKAVPTGSQSTEHHGRQRTRGRGDGGQSASHPRGAQEKTSRQTPCLEGDLPSPRWQGSCQVQTLVDLAFLGYNPMVVATWLDPPCKLTQSLESDASEGLEVALHVRHVLEWLLLFDSSPFLLALPKVLEEPILQFCPFLLLVGGVVIAEEGP